MRFISFFAFCALYSLKKPCYISDILVSKYWSSPLIMTIIHILGDDQMLIQGATTSSSIRSRTPIDERIRIANIAEEVKKSKLADVQDLIHLQHPLSEDLVLRTLQARYFNKNYFVSLILGWTLLNKVENISKCSLDLIPSPSTSVKIQIMGGKFA